MKKYIIIIFSLLLSSTIWSQVLSIPDGTSFHVPGNVNLILSGATDLNVNSENTTFAGNVRFVSEEEQVISGSIPLELANLYVDNNGLILDNDLFVINELDMQKGIINLQTNNLTVENILQGNFSDNTMIVNDANGVFQRNISGNGLYVFPVGDISEAIEYSPVEIDMLNGTYTNASVSVSTVNEKYSLVNPSSVSYLNRYWDITSSGITNPDYDINLTYLPADVAGNESEIYGAYYSDEWNLLNLVADNSIVASNVNEFGIYTGGEQSAFVVGVNDILKEEVGLYGLEDGIRINTNLEVLKIEVFNVLGQKIYEQKELSSNTVNFNSNVQTAVYFVRIQTNKGVVSKKTLIY